MSSVKSITTQLVQVYNLSNVKVVNAQKNPYENRIPGAVNMDPALYQSELGTNVMSDITFGDKQNTNNNQWKDNNGQTHNFKPLTLITVLFNISQTKEIVKTKIQGRPGTVKEYIADGDYSIEINGVITGTNGHYPIDEVRQLKDILDAPIAIPVTSWYLQNLDIHSIVVESYEIDQAEGSYAYQQFSIKAVSDTPVELKISDSVISNYISTQPIIFNG